MKAVSQADLVGLEQVQLHYREDHQRGGGEHAEQPAQPYARQRDEADQQQDQHDHDAEVGLGHHQQDREPPDGECLGDGLA